MRYFIIALVTGIQLVNPCAAANEACPLSGSSTSPVRNLSNGDLTIQLRMRSAQWTGCILQNQCSWGPFDLDSTMVSGLGPYASPSNGTCWTSYNTTEKQHVFLCNPEFEFSGISDVLTALLAELLGAKQCALAGARPALTASIGGSDYLVFPILGSDDPSTECLIALVRLRDFQPSLIVQRGCDRQAMDTLASLIPSEALSAATTMVISTRDKRGLAVSWTDGNITAFKLLTAWGLDEGSVQNWVVAVSHAALSHEPLADKRPFESLETSAPRSRFLQWLAAVDNVMEGESPQATSADVVRGRSSRDWISRNVLTRKADFRGTQLVP